MGCDIHAHVEIKVEGEWLHYNHPSVDRRYMLFARMANVRNGSGYDAISEPRGLPDDITPTTKLDRERWAGDAHSDSWLTAEEVSSIEDWMRTQFGASSGYYVEQDFGYIFGNGWDIKKYPNDYPDELEDARLVFWFDN